MRAARTALILAGLVALGGCAMDGFPFASEPATPPAPDSGESLEVATRSDPTTADTPSAAPPAPTAAELREIALRARLPELHGLVGESEDRLRDLLGQPQFARRDDPARLWQYRSAACFLDVFLYPDAGGAAYEVAHVAVRSRGAEPVPTDDCFMSLLEAGTEG